MTENTLHNVSNPTADHDVATKIYVDSRFTLASSCLEGWQVCNQEHISLIINTF